VREAGPVAVALLDELSIAPVWLGALPCWTRSPRRSAGHALLRQVRDVGLTVVAISHDDELLAAVADHVHDLAGADGDVRRDQAGTPAASTIGPPAGW
jgi:hypothetical protein